MDRATRRLRAVAAAIMLVAWESVMAASGVPVAALPVTPAGEARAPIGWIDFCRRHPADCAVAVAEPERIALNAQTWKLLQTTNAKVNAAIRPMTDMEHWGAVESWDYPDDGRGDCEDYALLKRQRLVAAGLSRRALLMTVVIDDERAGHAVLMVRTDRGDFVLDNKTGAIKPWNATGYVYVKRESQGSAGWVSLGGAGSATATAAR